MMQWLRKTPKWGPAHEPETAYLRARHEWDKRLGAGTKQARSWRIAALLSIGLSLFLAWNVSHFAGRVTVYPYVVEVDHAGQVRSIGTLPQQPYEPTKELMGKLIGEWVINVRSITMDPIVERNKWWRAYYYLTAKAEEKMNAYIEATNPLQKVGKESVVVEVSAVVPLSERTYQAHWVETVYDLDSQRKHTTKYTGIFHTVLGQPSANETARRENPLGVYIAAFDWTKDLTVSQKD
jgi:type IV secretion system protein VirB5